MAAEPTPQQSVEETATPVVLRTQTDDASHDVVGESSTEAPAGSNVHGEFPAAAVDRLVHDIVDEVVNSAEVSISGGSDTEASRPDQLKKDDKGHSRTSSVKKPATFKPVSVNKTFLASKATSSTSVPKVGEKPSTPVPATAAPSSTSSTPKPRLVAKTAGGLRDASKASLSQNGRPAPDGSAVWNKNRPVPVPDPKKFTDEELAKIGIHMAHRIQADDTKGQSNAWADIDDDDEDWDAPEAITWTDGTKTTIPHVDETTTVPEQPVIQETKPIDKPLSPAPPVSVPPSSSPSVKPGSLASGKGLVLTRGASSEKPTLVAKPPAPPTPVKSPWAPLPPISKISPMDVPHDQQQRGFAPPGQGYGLRGGPPPAAREIAADDFSRSPRRDNQQLYNSHSGRYEPVPDRRGMPRAEYPQRQPAVLQRPMHSEMQGPAEPSAAFQTSHTSGGFGRRRNSSNVSGGSGSYQRMGRPYDHSMPPAEVFNARRSSLASVGDHPPLPPHNFPPPGPQAGPQGAPRSNASPYQSRVSPAMSSAAPVVPDVQEAAVPPQPAVENTVEFQKRLMQERRAEAIKRRQEEEAQEEAARKERLAKKLAALGPAPERKSAKKEDSHEAAKTPAAQSSETIETAQAPGPKEAQPTNAMADDKSTLLPNGVQPEPQARSRPSTGPEQPPVAENKHAHPWQPRMPNQPERIWGSGSQPPRNLWGAPNNDRTLGNGTFSANAGFDTQPPQPAPMHGNRPVPGPIAPPRGAASSGPSSRLGPIGPPQRHEPRSTDEKERNRSRWAQAAMAADEDLLAEERERRAELERDMRARGLSYADMDAPIQDSWMERNEEGKVQKRAELTYSNASAPWHVTPGAGQDDQRRVAVPPSAGQNGSAAATSQSRFFPSGRDAQQLEPLAPDTGRPFEEDAFGGDTLYSHAAPPIRVKLPPAPTVTAPPASQRHGQPGPSWGQGPSLRDDGAGRGQALKPSFGASHTGTSQGVNTPIMDRIKNLFADKPSSVNSSSRTALLQPSPATPATVSLPFIYAPSTIVNERSFTTKKMDEDCFEEQEMGSLPLVHLPADIPDAAYNLAKAPPRQDRRLLPVMATTAEALPFFPDSRNIFIQLPNGPDRKSVSRGSLRSPNPRRGSRGPSRYGSSYRGGNRGRDSATPYSPEQPSASGANTGSGAGRGGRGYRGRSDNWGRAAAPAIQTQ